LIIDPDTLEFEPIQNPNIALGHGAGIQSAQLLANKGVTVVLTGNCGPMPFRPSARPESRS
jgi:predicted Fe-Mo cluster-binding NifX family protein